MLVVGPSRVFMNYIERVLPSLGEESVTLRSIGSVASDVVQITGDRVDDPPTAAVKGSLRMLPVLRRLVHEPPQAVPLELRVTVKGQVLVLPAGDARRDPGRRAGPPQAQPGSRGRREGAAQRALADPARASVDLEREEFDEQVADLAAFTMFGNAWWPAVSAHGRAAPGWPTRTLAVRLAAGDAVRGGGASCSAPG